MKAIKRSIWLLCLIALLVLVGCGSDSTDKTDSDSTKETTEEDLKKSTDASDSGGEVKIAINAQPPTLDPHMSTAGATTDVSKYMFESLLTIDSKYNPVPMLAESVDVSDDNKLFTFHLREGVLFHNGEEMTAEDVVASMNRWKE